LKDYDEPEILPSQLARICLIGADVGQRYRIEVTARCARIT
jgi:hypothetical protein